MGRADTRPPSLREALHTSKRSKKWTVAVRARAPPIGAVTSDAPTRISLQIQEISAPAQLTLPGARPNESDLEWHLAR